MRPFALIDKKFCASRLKLAAGFLAADFWRSTTRAVAVRKPPFFRTPAQIRLVIGNAFETP